MPPHNGLVFGEIRSHVEFDGDFYSQDDSHTCRAVPLAVHDVWFQDSDAAPCVPTDPLFCFEATTVFIGHLRISAAGIGNSLLSLLLSRLHAEASAIITKVRPVKFALNARIECQGFCCEMKVRVYQQEAGHVVEFQRRGGDACLFARIYQRAASLLKQTWAPLDAPLPVQEVADTELYVLPPMQFLHN